MMNTIFVTAVLLLVVLKKGIVVTSYPNGAGQCIKGMAAVGGTHLMFEGSNGTLAQAETVFKMDNIPLNASETYTFPPNVDITWSLESNRVAYRGLLIRVEADSENAFVFDATAVNYQNINGEFPSNVTWVQNDPNCSAFGNVQGITHVSRDDKFKTEGIINFPDSDIVTIDITVVFVHREVIGVNKSFYAYSNYSISIGSDSLSSVPSTVSSPVPVFVESVAPSPPPVIETDAPSPYPVIETDAPIPIPVQDTNAPTEAPNATPVEVPPTPDKCVVGKGKGKGMGMEKGMMGKGKGKGDSGKGKGDSGKGKEMSEGKGMGKGKGDADDDERYLRVGINSIDPCETEAPSDYPSASPTAEPTVGKGKGKMMKEKKEKDSKKGKKMMEKIGKGGDATIEPSDYPSASPTSTEVEGKGKGGMMSKSGGMMMGKGKGYESDYPSASPTAAPTTLVPTVSPTKGKGKGKGGSMMSSTVEDSEEEAPEEEEPEEPEEPEEDVETKGMMGKGERLIR